MATPSLAESFRKKSTFADRSDVLEVRAGGAITRYDFTQRLMFTISQDARATPFIELDDDVLNAARDRLIELGGNPPELASSQRAGIGKPAVPRAVAGAQP